MFYPLPSNAYLQNGRIYIPGLTGNIPAGSLKIRVRASGTRPTGLSLASGSPFTENLSGGGVTPAIRPSAPTFVSYSDSSNTFTFRPPTGYTYMDCDYVLNGVGPLACNSNTINVGTGNVGANALEVFVRALLPDRLEGEHLSNHIFFTQDPANIATPEPPTGTADDTNNTLTIYHPLGIGELLISTNSGAYTDLTSSVISVGNVNLPVGYYRVKVKSAPGRNESSVYNSPQFYATATATAAPTVTADDLNNILFFASPLGDSEILVSVNNGAFNPYTGSIQVGNVARPAGYYKAKVRAGAGRAESGLTSSPEFTATSVINPPAPTFSASDSTNTLSFDSPYGTSELVVSIGGSGYTPYAGPYNVGDVDLPAGYYLAKVKSATGRNESSPTASPSFSKVVVNTTPEPPVWTGDDVANLLTAYHPLGNGEMQLSVNNGAFGAYTGTIQVGDIDLPAGYYKIKVKAATRRNESSVVNSPAFTRQVSLTPVINNVSPGSGPVGTVVTITGTNLSPLQSLLLNGVAVSVTSSTATQVVFTVPQGANSGNIQVITTNGSATSPTSFTVTATPNQNPTVSVTLDTPGTLASGGTQVATASPLDADGTIASVSLTDNGNLVATRLVSPYVFSWQPTGAGSHTVTVTTTDNNGGTASATASFTLAAAAPTFNTTYNPGDNISTATYNGAPGTRLLLNLPLSSNPDPNPATMTIYAPDGTTQVGQLDFSGFDSGVQFGFVLNGTTYISTLLNGDKTLS